MGYLKYVSYLYLVAAVFFLYKAIMRIQADESPLIEFLIAGLAVFMFFFRRWNQKKFEDRYKDK